MAEIMKEWLVRLSYQVQGQQQAERGVSAIGGALINLAKVAAAATVAVQAAVVRISNELDALYFAGQRTNSTVGSIRALGYAVSQLGGSYQAAVGSLEAFSQRMRTNPGYESMVRQLGVTTRINGQLRNGVDIMRDLGKVLKEKPYYVAYQYAEALGIDEATFRALMNGDLAKRIEEHAQRAKELGVDHELAAKRSNDFWTAVRSLGATLEAIGTLMAEKFTPALTELVKQFDKFLRENADTIVNVFRKLGEALVSIAEFMGKIIELISPLWKGFIQLAESLTGQDGLNPALVALGAILALTIIPRLVSMIALAAKLRLGWLALAAVVAMDLTKTPEQREQDRKDLEDYLSRQSQQPGSDMDLANRAKRGMSNAWNWTKRQFGFGERPAGKADAGPVNKDIPPEARALLSTIASTESPDYNVLYGGGRFSGYADHPRQNIPITSGPNAGKTSSAAGKYQFLGSTWDRIAKKYGIKDFSPANQDLAAWLLAQEDYKAITGRNLLSDLKSQDPAALASIGRALSGTWTSLPGGIEQGQNGKTFLSTYLRNLKRQQASGLSPPNLPAVPNVQQSILDDIAKNGARPPDASLAPSAGDRNMSIQNRTEINILGSSDPSATAAQVGERMNSVNAGLIRNVQGAVR